MKPSKRLFILITGSALFVGAGSMNHRQAQQEPEIIIKNKADYSGAFIEGIKQQGFSRIELRDSMIFFGGNDTVFFPKTPVIGKMIVLTGRKDNLAIALTVKRLNYTTIDYKIEMVEFGQTNHVEEGTAELSPGFFNATESDVSDLSGLTYFSTEYSNSKGNCQTTFRLGIEQQGRPYVIAKLVKNCNGKIRAILRDNFVTLVEK